MGAGVVVSISMVAHKESVLVATVNRSVRAETGVSKWINFRGSALCGLIFVDQLQTTKSTKIPTLTV